MAKTKRIWRESQHPRDAKGRFSRRGGAAWIKRAASEIAAQPGSADTRSAAGRPRISRQAKAGTVLQAHADGGRPSAVRVPQARVTPAPSPKNLADFNAKGLPVAKKTAAPAVRNLDAFNAPDPLRPVKRTPRAAPGAAALRERAREEQAPFRDIQVAARSTPEAAPVNGAEAYAAMRRHTLLALARDAGISIRGKTNTQIANELAAHDAKVKADRAAKLNPSGVGTSSDEKYLARVRENGTDPSIARQIRNEPLIIPKKLQKLPRAARTNPPERTTGVRAGAVSADGTVTTPDGKVIGRLSDPMDLNTDGWVMVNTDTEPAMRIAGNRAGAGFPVRVWLDKSTQRPVDTPRDGSDNGGMTSTTNGTGPARPLNGWARDPNAYDPQAQTRDVEVDGERYQVNNLGAGRQMTIRTSGRDSQHIGMADYENWDQVAAAVRRARAKADAERKAAKDKEEAEYRANEDAGAARIANQQAAADAAREEPLSLLGIVRANDIPVPDTSSARDVARRADRLAKDGNLDAAEVELQNGMRAAGVTPADAKRLGAILAALKDVRAGRRERPAPEAPKAAAPGADTEHLKRPKAKKGDLVVIERETSSYTVGRGHEVGTEVRVGIVTSTDRDGRVTSYSTNADGSYPQKVGNREKTYKLEQERVDVQGAMAAAAANPWPHDPSKTGKPFASLAEARAAVAPHLGDQSAKVKADAAAKRGAAKRRPASEAKVTEAAVAMRQEKDYAKALRLIDEGEAADPDYKDKQGRGWGDFRTFVTAQRDRAARDEARRKEEEAGPKESAADLAIGRDLYNSFISSERAPFDYGPSHAERDAAEQRARDEFDSLLPSGGVIFNRDTIRTRMARAEGAVAAFRHQREAKRAEIAKARALIAKIEDPEYRKVQEKEILRKLEFEEETLTSAIHRQEDDAARARADFEKAMGRGADRDKLIARRRSEAADRARGIANDGGRSYGDSGAGAKIIAKHGTRPSSADLKAMSQRDREDAQSEMIMRGSHQDDLSKVVRSGLRNVDTSALTPEQRQAWIDATDAPTRALVHTLAARQRRDLALSRLAKLEAHQDRPSDAPELRAEIDAAIAQERANLDYAQSELATLEPEFQANLDRVEAAVNAVRATAGLKPAKLNRKGIDTAYAKRIDSAGITPQPNPPAPPAPVKPKTKLVFAPRKGVSADAKRAALDAANRRAALERRTPRQLAAEHAGLTRTEFDGLSEERKAQVLADLRKAAADTATVTVPSNRTSMGTTIRGATPGHVHAANAKLRELTHPMMAPVDNSISGRAARLRAGDSRALDGATIADLNEIAREAGLGGGMTGWPRNKLVDYIRNQVEAGPDRMKAAREGRLADALRGATPNQALAVLDARESEYGVTIAELKAAAKALGIKVTGDKRSIRNALAKGAGSAAPKADAAPVAAPARGRITPDAKRGALAASNSRVDTSRDNSQNGGVSNTPTTEASMVRTAVSTGTPQLGVTESSRGRTTTVTLPDGSTAQRTSRTKAYTHAVVAIHDLHAQARDRRAEAEATQRHNDAYAAWIANGANLADLVAVADGSGSIADDRAGLVNYQHYLPGFEARRNGTYRNGRTPRYEGQPGAFAITSSQRHRSGGPFNYTTFEGYQNHEERLAKARARQAQMMEQVAELEAGPQHEYYVARWSQRVDSAHAAVGSAELSASNTRYQVIGVGGVATDNGKPAKKVPTAEEKAAAAEAKKQAEKDAAAKRRQDFFDDKIKRITAALAAPGNEGRDNPDWHLQMTTEEALVSLAKHLGARVPRREKNSYGQAMPHDQAALRKVIIDAIRARRAEGKA